MNYNDRIAELERKLTESLSRIAILEMRFAPPVSITPAPYIPSPPYTPIPNWPVVPVNPWIQPWTPAPNPDWTPPYTVTWQSDSPPSP